MNEEPEVHFSDSESHTPRRSRGDLVRDVIVFQLKLAIDGLKDIVLSPLSIAATILDLIRGGDTDGHLYQVLRLGQRFEYWLDLYGEADDGPFRTGSSLGAGREPPLDPSRPSSPESDAT